MKRIGIITIHNSPSYGGSLQSFALWKYIDELGYDCEIIDLYRPYQKEYIKSKKFKFKRKKRSIFHLLKKYIKILLRRNDKHFSNLAKAKFDEFNSSIKFSRPYYGLDDLYMDPPKYDIYITGSDQVWNPEQPYHIEPYFLTFAPDNARKISYASSIGITELYDDERNDFKKWLSSYFAISVREKQAKDLLKTFIEKEIYQVSDPTFLLDIETWKSLSIHPNINDPYLLLFPLENNPLLTNYAIKLCKESGLKLFILNMLQPDNNEYISVKDAGPREFIGFIEKAEMVITDSFHASVFSIIMGTKNFYVYISKDNNKGSRIINLLKTYKIDDHLLNPDLLETYDQLNFRKIDKDAILRILLKEQKYSREFLMNQLL